MNAAPLLERIAASHAALAPGLAGGPAWAERRRRALVSLLDHGLPDRRDENWMRTDLRLFKPAAWGPSRSPDSGAAVEEGLLAEAILSGELVDTADGSGQRVAGRLAGRFASLDGHVMRRS